MTLDATALDATVLDDRVRADGTPVESSGLLVLLHGHDSAPDRILALGHLLDTDGDLLVVAPAGPIATPNGRRGWFTPGPRGVPAGELREMGAALASTIGTLIADEALDAERVIVAGFSQGAAAALAFRFGPWAPRPAATIAVAGFLPEPDGDLGWDLGGTEPVLLIGGDHDEVVPPDLCEMTADTLTAADVPTTYASVEAGHQITADTVATITTWVASELR